MIHRPQNTFITIKKLICGNSKFLTLQNGERSRMTKWNLHLLTRIQINYLTLEILNKVLIKLRLFKKRRRKKYKKLMFRMIKLISRHKSKDQHMEVSNTPIKLNIKTVRLCNCKKKEILLKYKIKESIFKRQHKFFNRDLMIKFNLEDKLYFCNNKHKITMKKAS
jgi:hypothetical protein